MGRSTASVSSTLSSPKSKNGRLLRIVERIVRRHLPQQDAATILVVVAERPELAGQFIDVVSPPLLVRHQNLDRIPNVALPVWITVEPLGIRVVLDQRYDH